jgi:hypothetical protein
MKSVPLFLAALLLVPLLWGPMADAEPAEAEPVAILEIGGAGEWALKDDGPSYGPSLAVETTPIEHWLEIEGGIAPLFAPRRTEWDTDLLFKKPFTLSDTVEFMIGAGPGWSHTIADGRSTDAAVLEVALDFMFWPWKGRTLGWYIEPSYGYQLGVNHERTFGVSIGLLVPIK